MSVIDSDPEVRLSQAFVTGEVVVTPPPRTGPPPLPRKPAAAPVPAPTAAPLAAAPANAAAATEEPPAEAVSSWRQLQALPSWLISSVVHLIALLTLALCTYAELRPLEPQTLHANLAPATALEELEALTIAAPLEQAESVAAEMPTSEALLASDVTELPSTIAGHSSSITTDVDAVQVGEIGELFSEAGQGMSAVAGNGGSAEFFGVKAGGRKFVFIVDSSNSMRGRKFSDAKRELLYAVKKLDKQQMFYVIFFDRDAECMFSTPGREPETRPLPATGENIRRLDKWLPLVENEGRTDPYDAVKIALALHPDAIFLLSDGQFTDGGRTESYLAEKNLFDDPLEGKRRPLVTVHTIAFYSQDGEVTMKAIAKAYNGTYRFVSKP